MKFEIVSDHKNVLLKRREIVLSISHPSAGTPYRAEIKRQLGAKFDIDLECVYVAKLRSKTGRDFTEGEVRIYDSPERARLVEKDYVLNRNVLPKDEVQKGNEAQKEPE